MRKDSNLKMLSLCPYTRSNSHDCECNLQVSCDQVASPKCHITVFVDSSEGNSLWKSRYHSKKRVTPHNGESQTPNFYDFGISGRVPETQNQYNLSLETPGRLKKIKIIPGSFLNYIILVNLKMLEIDVFVDVGKNGRRKSSGIV